MATEQDQEGKISHEIISIGHVCVFKGTVHVETQDLLILKYNLQS